MSSPSFPEVNAEAARRENALSVLSSTADWQPLRRHFAMRIEAFKNELVTLDPLARATDIARLQGKIDLLRELASLPERLREFVKEANISSP